MGHVLSGHNSADIHRPACHQGMRSEKPEEAAIMPPAESSRNVVIEQRDESRGERQYALLRDIGSFSGKNWSYQAHQ
jgi:hypothetical protein